ncbi:HD-GYP domain-containing protein [Alkalihalobacillus sp. AL-G]|uniref:HD-GYP domain-containing protein n=1 Tax=Alkalihalobacillus sp. AL-G TaxID=2926399 RepID=UPI00272D3F24|nr:HD-GYP domain-containing protein [Alkalihalobacillus sp. AL-G]WLD93402.1 HD-GYP domain-containing protein [Alkalihalobacillus sp. AL-G]
MRVRVDNLATGVVLEDDIYSLTSRPIIKRGTELTEEHIQLLNAFMVREVKIKEQIFQKDTENDSSEVKHTPKQEKGFDVLYRNAVSTYKILFNNWQAGSAIDIYKLRNVIVPLVDRALENPRCLFSLHYYSNVQDYIYHHAVSVSIISSLIAKRLSFSKGDIIQIGLAGALIDCGMSKIQPRILMKKSSLSQLEFDEVKEHPTLGFKMLKRTTGIKEDVMLSVLQHHEREDGSGYPLGIKGMQIHTFSRIVAIADVFHAMTSERLYRGKQSPFKVLEQMLKDQFGKFDPKALSMLVNEFTNLSIGTKVFLTNGKSGEIVFIEPQSPTRPMIKLDGNGEILVLKQQSDLYIESIR